MERKERIGLIVIRECAACAKRVLRVCTSVCTIRVNERWRMNEYKTSNIELLHRVFVVVVHGQIVTHSYASDMT